MNMIENANKLIELIGNKAAESGNSLSSVEIG